MRHKEINRRVCVLTTVHVPFDTRIFHKEAKTLISAGYEVTLIAQHTREETVDGVHIIPLPVSRNRFDRMTRIILKALHLALRQKAIVYHFHDPELLPAGIFLKICGKRVIYDAHEHVAKDILGKPWIKPQLRSIVSSMAGILERCASCCFDAVIAATGPIAASFPRRKSLVIQNYPIPNELVSVNEIPYRQRESILAYVGCIDELRGIREMIAAMANLRDEANVSLVLAGSMDANLESELRNSSGWAKVNYLGFQRRDQVAELLGSARLGMVLFHPAPNYDDSQPNKLFEYMSVGIPVIASNFPIWKSMIESIGCGLVVDPLNIEEIIRAIEWILDHPVEAEAMGQRGRDAVHSTYNWNTQALNLLAAYERVAS